MDFTKFVSLMDKKTLFFTKVSHLEDKFEGSLSKVIIDPKLIEQMAFERKVAVEVVKKELDFLPLKAPIPIKLLREHTFVNSWHMNEYESAAMWKLYLKSEDGIAIQSTYQKLADSFKNYDEGEVFIGEVSYIDYEKDTMIWGNIFYPFINKRKSFEHERELRAITLYFPEAFQVMKEDGVPEPKVRAIVSKNGLDIPIDLEMLVETIYISPTAENWFEELVRSIVKKYDFNKTVVKSSLANDPIF